MCVWQWQPRKGASGARRRHSYEEEEEEVKSACGGASHSSRALLTAIPHVRPFFFLPCASRIMLAEAHKHGSSWLMLGMLRSVCCAIKAKASRHARCSRGVTQARCSRGVTPGLLRHAGAACWTQDRSCRVQEARRAQRAQEDALPVSALSRQLASVGEGGRGEARTGQGVAACLRLACRGRFRFLLAACHQHARTPTPPSVSATRDCWPAFDACT